MIWNRFLFLSLLRKSHHSVSSVVRAHTVVQISTEMSESFLGLTCYTLRVPIKIYRKQLSSGYSKQLEGESFSPHGDKAYQLFWRIGDFSTSHPPIHRAQVRASMDTRYCSLSIVSGFTNYPGS